jgi:Tfp pilus assembly protein PilF
MKGNATMKTTRTIVLAVVGGLAFTGVICGSAPDSPRRIQEGALTPEFNAVDTAGKPFAFTRSGGKALVLAFVSSQQERSQKAVVNIFNALSGIPSDKLASLQVAFVVQSADNKEFISWIRKKTPPVARILIDEQYRIWGQFGVIATPTVFVSDPRGKVLCVKAGHAYDFASVVKSRLFQALEIPSEVKPEHTSNIRTVANNTMSARAKRHLQMARLLSEKGKVASAVKQAQMAYQIDPNSTEVALELGHLLCRTGKAREALKIAGPLAGQNNRQKARINLIMGWAKRQIGQLQEAEKFLQEGVKQDPNSPRLRFELGRIYQKRNDSEKAMQAYFRALQLIYGENRREL